MNQLIWAALLHMSNNMWNERHPRLDDVFDERLWRQFAVEFKKNSLH